MIIYEYNYWRISEARAQARVGPGSATPLCMSPTNGTDIVHDIVVLGN